jgi:hypothetical protein
VLHTLLLDAMSAIMRLDVGEEYEPVWHGIAPAEMELLLKDNKVRQRVIEQALAFFEKDLGAAITIAKDGIREQRLHRARMANRRAKNYRLRRDLYLPEHVSVAARSFSALLDRLLMQKEPSAEDYRQTFPRVSHEAVQAQYATMKDLMRKELARSDFLGAVGSPGGELLEPLERDKKRGRKG